MESRSPGGDRGIDDAVAGLRRGDFSRLSPLFERSAGPERTVPRIVTWHEQGLLATDSPESAEALTCACFLGAVDVAEYLLRRGIGPAGGMGTGLNAVHWAANRGQLAALELLLRYDVPLETRSMYDGTALGTAVWAAIHEPKPDHLSIIETLLDAGADVQEADYPTGDARIDELLRRFGAA